MVYVANQLQHCLRQEHVNRSSWQILPTCYIALLLFVWFVIVVVVVVVVVAAVVVNKPFQIILVSGLYNL